MTPSFFRSFGRLARLSCAWSRLLSALALCSFVVPVLAAEVGLAGVFPGKALLTINGATPRTVAVGSRTEDGVLVLAVDRETATVEINGKKRVLRVGQYIAAPSVSESATPSAVLTADGMGHFLTTGTVNGKSVRFLVDTGASMIALGAGEARRIGVDANQGEQIVVSTANGQTLAARVKLDNVRVGEIVVYNVDAMVHQHDLPFALLGMSFLNRMEMQRNGETMTLKKRY